MIYLLIILIVEIYFDDKIFKWKIIEQGRSHSWQPFSILSNLDKVSLGELYTAFLTGEVYVITNQGQQVLIKKIK